MGNKDVNQSVVSSVLGITISFGKCLIIRRRYVQVNRTGGVIGSYEKRQLKIYAERGKIFDSSH